MFEAPFLLIKLSKNHRNGCEIFREEHQTKVIWTLTLPDINQPLSQSISKRVPNIAENFTISAINIHIHTYWRNLMNYDISQQSFETLEKRHYSLLPVGVPPAMVKTVNRTHHLWVCVFASPLWCFWFASYASYDPKNQIKTRTHPIERTKLWSIIAVIVNEQQHTAKVRTQVIESIFGCTSIYI